MRRQFICVNCNIVVNYRYSKKCKNLFCSNKCQWDYDWKIRKDQIANTDEISSISVSRRFLIDTRGHICEICKFVSWRDKPIPLVCDHIDGNSDNWKLSNLRMICCNCDAQTDTYKNKNIGKGRHYRRLRYKEGKSF